MKQVLGLFLKGVWIGGTLSVPGVSGGSMAMILGIYEHLVQAVNVLISRGGKKLEALKFLLIVSLGGILGLLAVSGPILVLLERYPMQMVFFFSGAIAGGIPMIWAEGKSDGFKWGHIAYLFVGLAAVMFLRILPDELFFIGKERGAIGMIMQFIGGIIAAIALVLPGISVSHMLYVLGLYTGIITAISQMDLYILLPFVLGTAIGIVLTARAVDHLMLRFPSQTYMIILGFVLGSVVELIGMGVKHSFSIVCIPLFVLGYVFIYLLSRKRKANC